MLEYSFFNGWFYGTELSAINPNTINIGVFNPAGIRSLLNNNLVNLYTIRIITSEKERLLRQLNREEFPDCEEIIRRYQSDIEDFSNLEFNYSVIKNDKKIDKKNALNYIEKIYLAIKNN